MPISLLFTGHMIDKPDRPEPRFPASLEEAARVRITRAIIPYAPAKAGSGEPALGFASCARGGDILFHEQGRAHGIDTVIVLPFPPEVFVTTSVEGVPGSDWASRFWDLWNTTPEPQREVMDLPVSDDAYGACNARLLKQARQHGNVHLIALWDGKAGDGPGGTADLVARVSATNQPDIFSPESLQTGSSPAET
ncbi:hypothetical protein [Microvirga massiliensis]|uniref:hypothetical protein n=1 Tax=Microvirga massiliensis TaxID=1033741 RepID=UPI00065FCDEA|nr:hypothetical protein [Microvirga massiliensis]